jgi:hypothetical protein
MALDTYPPFCYAELVHNYSAWHRGKYDGVDIVDGLRLDGLNVANMMTSEELHEKRYLLRKGIF